MDAETSLDVESEDRVRQIARRLKAAVDRAGGNKRVAQESGVALRTLNSYLAAAADPKITKLQAIAIACGTSVDRLLGDDTTENGTSDVPKSVHASDAHLSDGFVTIPRLEVRASAGPGRMVMPAEDDLAPQVAFREGWLRSLGVAPANAEFVMAAGDSMYPTIHDGDLMLVDRGYGQVVNGKIYVLVVRGLVIVKRVNVLAIGGLMLISDNERYPTETVPGSEMDNLSVEARVAWYGRAM